MTDDENDGNPEIPDDEKLDIAFAGWKRDAKRLSELEDRVTADIERTNNRLDEVLDELTALRQRLPERSDTDPVDLDFEDQVPWVREQAYRRAAGTGGQTALDYKDIRWGLFNDSINNQTSYRLMRRAAGVDDDNKPIEDVPGFGFRKVGGVFSLTVDAEKAARVVEQASSARKSQRGDD